MADKIQRIRDPIHNLIEFDNSPFDQSMWKIIQTTEFQRLRRIKQLGFSDFVYPGATHTRFAHSLGVYFIAKKLLKIVESRLGKKCDPNLVHQALTTSLLHDVGHGPFSHAFEDVAKNLNLSVTSHEEVSKHAILHSEISKILEDNGNKYGESSRIAGMLTGNNNTMYAAIVSSQFDADRLDYMQRDRFMTGTQIGNIDFEWLVSNLEIDDMSYGASDEEAGTVPTFVLGPKAIYAAESYVLNLFHLYPTVYFHKTTRCVEKMFVQMFTRVIECIKDGGTKATNLPAKHPIVLFARNSGNLNRWLDLDDTVIMGAFPLLLGAKDKLISDFAARIYHRKLLKCIDVRECIKQGLKRPENALDDKDMDNELEQKQENIRAKIQQWLGDNTSRTSIILEDKGKRDAYKNSQEDNGPLNQIRVKEFGGKVVDIKERSKIIGAIGKFEFYRVYVDDNVAYNVVKEFIKGEGGIS